jgi:hypothetical protein
MYLLQMEAWQHMKPLAWIDWLINTPSWKVCSIGGREAATQRAAGWHCGSYSRLAADRSKLSCKCGGSWMSQQTA